MGPVAVDPSCQGQGIGKLLLDFPETVSDNVVIGKGKQHWNDKTQKLTLLLWLRSSIFQTKYLHFVLMSI